MIKGFLPVGLGLLSLFPITDLIHYVGVDHFQCTFDDRTLHPASYTFFGIQWKDCMVFYFTYTAFWLESYCLYLSIFWLSSHALIIRSVGFFLPKNWWSTHWSAVSSRIVSCLHILQFSSWWITCPVMISLGFFIGIKNSSLPSMAVSFWATSVTVSDKLSFLPHD